MIKAIVLDIEGTTTDIKFVHEVLFPYAKKNFPLFLHENEHTEKVASLITSIKNEYLSLTANLEEVIDLIDSWIDQDQKITQLKELQGLIWVDGYAKGDYQGHIYPEVKACLEQWKASGKNLYIYSSGSVFAQKLLFSHTTEGDLTSLFSGYFDTKIGHKREVESYENIVNEIQMKASEILFLSDIPEELAAAKAVGLITGHLNRDGLYQESNHPIYDNFNEVEL